MGAAPAAGGGERWWRGPATPPWISWTGTVSDLPLTSPGRQSNSPHSCDRAISVWETSSTTRTTLLSSSPALTGSPPSPGGRQARPASPPPPSPSSLPTPRSSSSSPAPSPRPRRVSRASVPPRRTTQSGRGSSRCPSST